MLKSAPRIANWLSPTFVLIAIEGAASLVALLLIPGDPSSGVAFGFSLSRLAMAAAIALGILFAAFAALKLRRQKAAKIHKLLSSQAAIWILLAASFAGLAFCLHWRYAAPELQASLERIFPLALFATLATVHLFIISILDPGKGRERGAALLALTVLLITFYVNSTLHYSVINREYWLSDQQSFMQFARSAGESKFTYTGGRNFMPAYPFLQAVFLDMSLSEAALFDQAKLVNIVLSLVLLVALFFVFRKSFNLYLAYLLTALLGFTLFIYKAAYMQPEILFYFLNFVAFFLMLRLFVKPDWRLAALAGLVLGVAHLTKASVLPAAILFAVFMLAKIIYAALAKRNWSSARKNAASFALVLVVFIATIFPYIRESKQIYGQYFYNVNSTFYIWYDSWQQVGPGTKAHGDAVGWPDMPADEIPSLAKYLREHTAGDIASRLATGYAQQARNIAFTFALVSFPVLLLGAMIVLAVQRWPQARKLIVAHPFLLAFVLTYFAAYLTLFAWYAPIAEFADQRFTYGLVMPFLFCAFFVLQTLAKNEPKKRRPQTSVRWLPAFYSAVAILLAADILFRVPIQLSAFHWFGK